MTANARRTKDDVDALQSKMKDADELSSSDDPESPGGSQPPLKRSKSSTPSSSSSSHSKSSKSSNSTGTSSNSASTSTSTSTTSSSSDCLRLGAV